MAGYGTSLQVGLSVLGSLGFGSLPLREQRIARRLLDARADKDVSNFSNRTALTCAAEVGYVEFVRLLLEAGADKDLPHRNGRTALICACERGHMEIIRLLLTSAADTNLKDNTGNTALSHTRDVETARLLIAARASVNSKDTFGKTALMHASEAGHVGLVRLLMQAGANTLVKDSWVQPSACFRTSTLSGDPKPSAYFALLFGPVSLT